MKADKCRPPCAYGRDCRALPLPGDCKSQRLKRTREWTGGAWSRALRTHARRLLACFRTSTGARCPVNTLSTAYIDLSGGDEACNTPIWLQSALLLCGSASYAPATCFWLYSQRVRSLACQRQITPRRCTVLVILGDLLMPEFASWRARFAFAMHSLAHECSLERSTNALREVFLLTTHCLHVVA